MCFNFLGTRNCLTAKYGVNSQTNELDYGWWPQPCEGSLYNAICEYTCPREEPPASNTALKRIAVENSEFQVTEKNA